MLCATIPLSRRRWRATAPRRRSATGSATARAGRGADGPRIPSESSEGYELPPKLPPSPGGGDERVTGAGAKYAATYHARAVSPGHGGDFSPLKKTGLIVKRASSPRAPAKLTAEFLDALGSRLSSVRDLLTAPHEPGDAPGTG